MTVSWGDDLDRPRPPQPPLSKGCGDGHHRRWGAMLLLTPWLVAAYVAGDAFGWWWL